MENLDTTFSALSDPTRRAILARLAQGTATVSDLARPFEVSLPAISRHLRILEQAGLLKRQKQGRVHHCSLAAEPLKDAADWIAAYRFFWGQRLDGLAEYLKKTE